MQNVNTLYDWQNTQPEESSKYLWKPLCAIIAANVQPGSRLFEIGSGNGATARMLVSLGYDVTGIESSELGVAISKDLKIHSGSAYDDLAAVYGTFPLIYSLEVVEHCFWPTRFAKAAYDLLEPGGIAIISTPYHGYLKNLVIALLNGFDKHWHPLVDGGHVKFFSKATLNKLLTEAGFHSVEYRMAGRVTPFAKSMIAIARRSK